jgi:hypothetical protein
MTTLTVEIADKDAELVIQVLQRLNAKVKMLDKGELLTNEIAAALKEVKEIHTGKSKAYTLDDI